MAIGPLLLTENEARETARRVYEYNPRLTSVEIGRAIGRSRQTVDIYISDWRAAVGVEMDLKTLRMNRNDIPQDRIAKRLGIQQRTVSEHLAKMPTLANPLNTDQKRGFTVAQMAEKHGWPEPLVWSIALEGKSYIDRFRALNWGLRTWDLWYWNDCDNRFGDEWPGRIPAQMIAHILYYFSDRGNLVVDPMVGGGVVADTLISCIVTRNL
ncbi:MAG: HTH domain-containing protein [Desulfobacterales bacterium]